MSNVITIIRKTQDNCALSGIVTSLDTECRNCAPITPLQCINHCQVYKLKNELRWLGQIMDNPHYIRDLLNALKNMPRLQILKTIEKNRFSIKQLQKEFRKPGQNNSLLDVNEEYLRPLIAVGLASENRDEFYASSFGMRLSTQIDCFSDFAEKLPRRSECYEETLLQFLSAGPRTFEAIEKVIEPSVVSRTLKRLRLSGLVKKSREKAYVFFFQTIRDPNKEILTANERKIYSAVSSDGISAGELSRKTKISKRLTYRYLKRLRGKKLIFIRKMPKTYRLTCKGEKLASVLQNIQRIVEDTWSSSQQILNVSGGVANKIGCRSSIADRC